MNDYDAHKNDPTLDRRLAENLVALHANLDRMLDLDAGLVDATLPGYAQTYAGDLDQVLDLDAGLAAILPSTPSSDSSWGPNFAPIGEHGSESFTTETPEGIGLLRIAAGVAAMPASERLRIRRLLPQPVLTRIRVLVPIGLGLRRNVRVRGRNLARALDHARVVARSRGSAFTFESACDLARALESDLARALDRARALDHDLTLDRFRDCSLDRDFAVDLALTLQRALNHTRALARSLGRAVDHDFHIDLDFTLAHARSLAHDLDRALDLALDGAEVVESSRMAEPVVAAFVRAVEAAQSAESLDEKDLLEAVDRIEQVTSDAVGADLEEVDLTDIPLVGVRWSSTTLWPPDWRDWVRRESTKIGPDLWRITRPKIDTKYHVTVE